MKVEKINKYNIRVPNVKNPIDTPVDEIKLHTICISVGRRGSGKSVSVFSKVKDLKEQGLCDRCYLISPTKYSNMHLAEGLIDEDDMYEDISLESLNDILRKVEEDAQDYEDYLKKKELYKLWKKLEKQNVDINDIDPFLLLELDRYGIFDLLEEPQPKYPKSKNGVGCFSIIFDDCQAGGMFQTKTFMNMALRHRHVSSRPHFKVGVSLWLLVQSYSSHGGLTKALRENCCVLCVFPVKQRDMIEKMAEEMGGEVSKEEFLEAYDYATHNDPHSFLMVDFNPKDKKKIFRKNWNEYIIMGDQVPP